MEIDEQQINEYVSKKSDNKKLVFGQILIGPPGSGKSTFCKAMYDTMKNLGRNVLTINLDPGNDIILPYEANIDICDLITVADTMENFNLGPNGQVELFIHNNTLKNVINNLIGNQCPIDMRLVCVNLVDSYYANDPGKYISALFTSLNAMLHFELPHVNILSKLDLMEKHKSTEFNLDYYCDVLNLDYLLDVINDDPFFEKYKKLSKSLTEIIENYSLVSFVPVNINEQKTINNALNHIDKANGFFLIRIETEQHKLRFQTDYTEMFTGSNN